MCDLRYTHLIPESEFCKLVDGQLIGYRAQLIRESFVAPKHLNTCNITFVGAGEGWMDNYERSMEGLKLTSSGQMDISLSILSFMDGIPENTSISPVFSNGWCKLLTSPALDSSTLTDGPESALFRIGFQIVGAVLLTLLIVIHLPNILWKDLTDQISAWKLYQFTMRQKRLPVSRVTIWINLFIIVTVYGVQVIFFSYLNTERASITSFEKINSIAAASRAKITIFTGDFSPCRKGLNYPADYHIISIRDGRGVYQDDFEYCIGSGKCSFLGSNIDANMAVPVICSVFRNEIMKHPLYFSPALVFSPISFVVSNNVPKHQRTVMYDSIHRSLGMGLIQQKGLESQHFGRQLTQIFKPDEECIANTITTGLTSAVSLSISYFRFIIYIYFLTVSFTIILYFYSLVVSGL